jgi:signal transduction histidine kinase
VRAGEQQERLIEALLTLARSQRGIEAREPVDLAAVVGELVRGVPLNGVRVRSVLSEARTAGDPALVERLAANLVDNAVHHNEPGGLVSVWTGLEGGCPTLRVVNAGPVIPPEEVGALVEPFRRLNVDRTGHTRGVGLGLSIVGAIATAHGAELRVGARAEGGLEVDVRFRPA